MSREYGIFNDESADYTEAEAVETGFFSSEMAESRLREIRRENGTAEDEDDNCYVHPVEEPEEEEEPDEEEEDEEESE